ncbi:MAG: tRNA (adenosine(37)-N6)-threonylcarbamoyltransferase complex ATPase subunit type 1 TsaE [Candidatus Omnitrophica bacterium]|nr:tRNA (adenosine(37)-N6)-threonylcarbamoyltransferase complex ATPase subunit type 1 TsaE [Candidatus Omnitrophota bacterium]MBU1852283.1 tRNA (adenosine(37)-N6)-threonylcarbamoyltransferase complex ATPase subunit type 1 TsaE [Candidatus Omnitrophota bacterium]
MFEERVTTYSPDETIALGEKVAKDLKKGDVIALEGGLGAGKTVFVKGLAKGLGVQDHFYVNSPTFVIIKEYQGRLDLYHFDVYRLDEEHFSDTLDYRRYFYGAGVTVIEWADKIKGLLPDEHLEVRITHTGETERQFEFRSHGVSADHMVGI